MSKLNFKELKKIVQEANDGSEIFLTESSYNRIRNHIENGASFVIITSDRHERTLPDYEGPTNNELYQQMKQKFKNAGFPFTEMKGGFKETEKTVEDPETGETKQVALEEPIQVMENSILATVDLRPDVGFPQPKLKAFTAQMAKEYDQQAFIFGEQVATSSGQQFPYIRAYDQGGNFIDETWAGPWSSVAMVEADEIFWSRIKGKHFQLRERKKTSQPRSWIEAFKKSRSGEVW
jgi:hypothetical protein